MAGSITDTSSVSSPFDLGSGDKLQASTDYFPPPRMTLAGGETLQGAARTAPIKNG
jgi:hypothetical protein